MTEDLGKLARDAERCDVDKRAALRGDVTKAQAACMADPTAPPPSLSTVERISGAFSAAAGAVKSTFVSALEVGVDAVRDVGGPVVTRNAKLAKPAADYDVPQR